MNKLSIAIKIFLLILLANAASGQIFKPVKLKDAQELKARPLIVLLSSESLKTIDELKNNEKELKAYRESIKEINSKLKSTIESVWKVHDNINYETPESIGKLINGSDTPYALITLEVIGLRYSNEVTLRSLNQVLTLNINFLEKYNPKKPLFSQSLPGFVTKNYVPIANMRDLLFAAQFIQNHLNGVLGGFGDNRGKQYRDNRGLLANKTLLLDTAYLDANLTEKEISETYSFKFKVSNHKEIEQAILSADERFAYVQYYPITSAIDAFGEYVIDCKNGTLMSMSYGGGRYIDEFHLKKYEKYSDVKKKK
jgi:hypothetical protein